MVEPQKILIVDDRPENLFALERTLKPLENLEIITAESGNEALSKTLDNDFALIILDVQMPEMDGYEVADLMREDKATRNTPIIFLSAVMTDKLHIEKGYESGAIDFVPKPYNPKLLLSKVKVFLELDRYRSNLEDIIALKTAELERSNIELKQFAYIASHDLQEPLRMTSLYSDMIADHLADKLDEKGEKYLNYMREGVDRMRRLIDDLLLYFKVQNRRSQFTKVDCNELVKTVLNDLSKEIEETRAEVTVAELPYVKGDEKQLAQVFRNLVGNSLKFVSDSPVTLDISAETHGDFAEFTVDDNGIGIPSGEQKHIFQIFQRLNPREDYSGTGIGLAVAKSIVEAHRGKIWVEQNDGKGVRFCFSLPLN